MPTPIRTIEEIIEEAKEEWRNNHSYEAGLWGWLEKYLLKMKKASREEALKEVKGERRECCNCRKLSWDVCDCKCHPRSK